MIDRSHDPIPTRLECCVPPSALPPMLSQRDAGVRDRGQSEPHSTVFPVAPIRRVTHSLWDEIVEDRGDFI